MAITTVETRSAPSDAERQLVKLVPRWEVFRSELNPRKEFRDEDLADLAESIRTEGILQPIVVRRRVYAKSDRVRAEQALAAMCVNREGRNWATRMIAEQIESLRLGEVGQHTWYCGAGVEGVREAYRCVGEQVDRRVDIVSCERPAESTYRIEFRLWPDEAFDIICGERRWRAAEIAGLESVPVIDRGVVEDATALRWAITENVKRANLNAMEEADGFAALRRIAGLREGKIAEEIGKSQPYVANRLRLLKLPEDVQQMIRKGELSPSHGIALAKHEQFPRVVSALAASAVAQHWSSAELEKDPNGSYPVAQALIQSDAMRRLTAARFPTLVCQSCPFDARRSGWWSYSDACLRPEHFDELQATYDAEIEAKARHVQREAVAVGGEELPRTGQMGHGSYHNLRWEHAPSGCTAECPCRGKALDGGQVVDVCLDTNRWRKLEMAATRDKNKGRRADAKAKAKRMLRLIDELTDLDRIGTAEIALLAAAATYGPSWNSFAAHRGTDAAITRHGASAVNTATGGGHRPQDWQSVGYTTAVQLAIEGLLGAELTAYADGTVGSPDWTNWYLAQREPKAAPEATTEPIEQPIGVADPNADADFICPDCGRSSEQIYEAESEIDEHGLRCWDCTDKLNAVTDPERVCRLCGCSDDKACVASNGLTCFWVAPDLCSACCTPEVGKAEYKRAREASS